jgi:hypothetical protein
MKSTTGIILAIAASCAIHTSIAASVARANPPIAATAFETDQGDWHLVNIAGQPTDAAKISITHEAANLKEGKGSLKLEYNVKKGDTNILAWQFQPPALAKLQSVHFWVKLDHSASVLLVVSEKDGDSYQEMIACPANTWQEVSVALSDLARNADQGSAKDVDGKLHPDRIDTVALIDADCYLAQIFGDVPFINIASGQHTLYLSPFTLTEAVLPIPPTAPDGEVALTPLLRPQVDWLDVGGMTVQKVTEKPLTGPSIRANYTQAKGKAFALLKGITPGSFAGVTQLSLTAASKKPTKLMVQLEQTDGNKFNTIIDTTGESEIKSFTLPISEFMIDKDSKDANAKLDLNLVKQLLIIDISGVIAEIQDTENSLWINNVRIMKKATVLKI